jgi:hypothetical protein
MYSFDSRESSNEIRNGEATLVAIRVRQPEGRLAENAEVRVEEKDSATVCQEIQLQVRTLDAFRTALRRQGAWQRRDNGITGMNRRDHPYGLAIPSQASVQADPLQESAGQAMPELQNIHGATAIVLLGDDEFKLHDPTMHVNPNGCKTCSRNCKHGVPLRCYPWLT